MAEQSEQQPDRSPESLSNDDLLSAIDDMTPGEFAEEVAGEAAQEAAEEEQADEPESESDEEQEATEKGTNEEPDAEADQEEEDAESLRLRLEEAESRARHFESKLGNITGREGFYKRKFEEAQREIESLRQRSDTDDEYQPHRRPEPRQQQPSQDTERVAAAMRRAGESFQSRHADEPEVIEAVTKKLQSRAQDVQFIYGLDDPLAVLEQTESLLESAYHEVKSEQLAAQRESLKGKAVDQAAKLKQQKRAAAVSSSDKKKPAAPRRVAKSPRQMSNDELLAAVKATEG